MPNTPPAPLTSPPAAPGDDADAREFDGFVQGQDPLDIEAATWVVRQRGGLDARGKAELQAWLDADPLHAAAFDDMDATFGDLQQLPDGDVASLKAGLPERALATPVFAPPRPVAAGSHPAWRPPWLRGFGPLLPQAAAAVLAVVLVGGGWTGWERWQRLPVFEKSYATARGQLLTVGLPDAATQGSTLQLDTGTRVDTALYRDRREVHLREGQALFEVQADARRPFHVWAGGVRITVVGTRFSVRHTVSGLGAGQTVVSVAHGRVRVAPLSQAVHTAAPPGNAVGEAIDLTDGQTVTAENDGRIGDVTTLSPGAVAPWREGRLSFDQTPLGDALAEFERYGPTGLVVHDPAVASLPVGGSYRVRQFSRFAETLPQVLPVRLVTRGEVTEVVAR